MFRPKQLRMLLFPGVICCIFSGCGDPPAIREYVIDSETEPRFTSELLRRDFPYIPFRWELPGSWSLTTNDQFSLRAWTVGPPERAARITLGRFPARTGIPAQVIRWRQQVGLSTDDPTAAMEGVTSLKTENGAGSYATIEGASETILAFILPIDSQYWIFRYKAKNETAKTTGDSFREFCQSLEHVPRKEQTSTAGRTSSSPKSAVPPVIGHSATTGQRATNTPDVPFQWDVPEIWSAADNDQFSLRAWTVGPPDSAARITLGRFPARAGVPAQVMRWRRQVGLSIDNPEAAMENVASLKTKNGTGSYATIEGASETILAFILPIDSQHWIFRYRGDNETAKTTGDSFRDFCQSVKYVSDEEQASAPATDPASAAPQPAPSANTGEADSADSAPAEEPSATEPESTPTSETPPSDGEDTESPAADTSEGEE